MKGQVLSDLRDTIAQGNASFYISIPNTHLSTFLHQVTEARRIFTQNFKKKFEKSFL